MRRVNVLKATGLIVAAVVLGLLSVQGSYALWNTRVPAGMGTIRAADFTVMLTGSNNSGTYDMVLADGTPATVSLTSTAAALTELYPGVSAYAGVRIENLTNAGSDFTVLASLPVPAAATDTGPGTGLSGYLEIRPAAAADLSQCSSIPDSAYLEAFTGVQIPKGGSAAVCFQIKLSEAAPSALQGQGASIAVPLHVKQIR